MKSMIRQTNIIIFKALVLSAFVLFGSHAFSAADVKEKKSTKTINKKAVDKKKTKYGTEFNFNDLLVRGEYAQPAEASATVEDEKILDDLLQVRKDFKDRLKQSSTKR